MKAQQRVAPRSYELADKEWASKKKRAPRKVLSLVLGLEADFSRAGGTAGLSGRRCEEPDATGAPRAEVRSTRFLVAALSSEGREALQNRLAGGPESGSVGQRPAS